MQILQNVARWGQSSMTQLQKAHACIPGGLFILSLGVHTLPFLKNGPHPLGYDTGFYRRYLLEPFLHIPNAPVPGLGPDALVPRIIFDLFRLTHLSSDLILYGSYVLLTALLPVLLYIFLRPTLGKRGAVIAGIVLIFSAVSYNAFWYLLWKNALALCFMFAAFIAYERKALVPFWLFGSLLALTHKTSALIYFVTLSVLLLLSRSRRSLLALHAVGIAALFLVVNSGSIGGVARALPQAVFLTWFEYLLFSLPFLLVIGAGYRAYVSARMPRSLVAFILASFAFPILHLPFYERIFVFCDVALVAVAAYAVEYLLQHIRNDVLPRTRYAAIAMLCIAVGLLLGNWWNQFKALQPLLPPSSVYAIEEIGAQLPPNATVLTSAEEAPWYEGFTTAHIAAPGMLQDTHNLEQWEAFWDSTSTPERVVFLSSFEKPLYISSQTNIVDLVGEPLSCMSVVTPTLWRFDCE